VAEVLGVSLQLLPQFGAAVAQSPRCRDGRATSSREISHPISILFHVVTMTKSNTRKKPMSSAERSKKHRKRRKEAFQKGNLSRSQLKSYLKEKARRSVKNKPVVCKKTLQKTSTKKAQPTPQLTWMRQSKTIQGKTYGRLKTHMMHSTTPSFVKGDVNPLKAKDNGDRQIYFLDETTKRWHLWFDKKKSNRGGCGLFAARAFQAGDICTRYMGQQTTSASGVAKMIKKSEGYVFKFKRKGRSEVWVAPDLNLPYMYGHFLNHDESPNCQVDAYSGVVTAIHAIDRGEELTIDYGNDYNWKGQTIVTYE
jgi:hypothetical protein